MRLPQAEAFVKLGGSSGKHPHALRINHRTSQLKVNHWHEAFGDPTLADAILDKLVHNAHRLKLAGESIRRRASITKLLDQIGQD